jgi:hypothetical protein
MVTVLSFPKPLFFSLCSDLPSHISHEDNISIIYKYPAEFPHIFKCAILWDITLCSPIVINRRFGETYCLHI